MKRKKKEHTPEEIRESELGMVADRFFNEPTILYKIGDKVQHGACKESHVTEILEGGKIIGLHQTVTDNNYGRPVDSERDIFVSWQDIQPYREQIEGSGIHKERYLINYYQTSLDGLLHRFYFSGVNFNPPYQRDFCWTVEDKQFLIESIFQDVDIGKFVFRKLPFAPHPAPHCEIVDGKQRLKALLDFYECRFKWRGLTYHELHWRDQYHFTGYNVSMGELSEDISDAQVIDAFLRLNTGGRLQDPAHIEKVKRMLENP